MRVLPWIVAAGALVVYLFTLNRWVTLNSLTTVAKVAGWDWWSLTLQAPLYHLVTSPIRLLPPSAQALALNIFSAVCAAGALGLLARSVAILPQDRTREQRQRLDNEQGLLTIRAAWVPPVFAAMICGFQLTFWENATAASVESLNLLLFAYIVGCLLEYRLDGKESRLYRMAFVYGLSAATNWAMIGFFPLSLMALIWIQKRRFFHLGFLVRLTVCGLLGLAIYLYLPWLEKSGNGADATFWQLFKTQLGFQKQMLTSFPKYVVLICCLSSILPVFLIGFRLPSSFGDTSVVGSVLTHFMYRFAQAALLVLCLFVAFDPMISPRKLGFGLAFLPFYFLGALSIGYFSGYFLLACGVDPQVKFYRISPRMRLLNQTFFGLVCVAAIGVPAALALRNYPGIAIVNNPAKLTQYAAHLVASLPAQGAMVMSDEPQQLFLIDAYLARQGRNNPHVLLDAQFGLSHHWYLNQLHKRQPEKWPDVLHNAKVPDPIDSARLVSMMTVLSRTNPVYYLQPHCGIFAEGLMLEPQGLVFSVKPYPPGSLANLAISPTMASNNLAFWGSLKAMVSAWPKYPNQTRYDAALLADGDYVKRAYSRSVNRLGVELQRSGMLTEAGSCFDLAQEFNPDNAIAWVNQQFNRNLRAGNANPVEVPAEITARLGAKYARWNDRIYENGPFDEPRYCMEVGESLAKNDPTGMEPPYLRQPAQQFQRVLELNPDNWDAGIWLANMYLKMSSPSNMLRIVAHLEARRSQQPISLVYQIELVRLKALAYTMMDKAPLGLQLLQEVRLKNPAVTTIPEIMAQIYLQSGDLTNSLACFEEELKLEPGNCRTLINVAAMYIRLRRPKDAIPHLTHALQIEPNNDAARINRAIANLSAGMLDDAEKDYRLAMETIPKGKLHSLYSGLAEISWQRKDNAKAVEYYRKFLELLPRNKIGGVLMREDETLLNTALERLKQMGVADAK